MKFYVVVNYCLVGLYLKFHKDLCINARAPVVNAGARVFCECVRLQNVRARLHLVHAHLCTNLYEIWKLSCDYICDNVCKKKNWSSWIRYMMSAVAYKSVCILAAIIKQIIVVWLPLLWPLQDKWLPCHIYYNMFYGFLGGNTVFIFLQYKYSKLTFVRKMFSIAQYWTAKTNKG